MKTEHLAEWPTRVMISAALFRDPDPEEMARARTAFYGYLHLREEGSGTSPRPGVAARRGSRKERR